MDRHVLVLNQDFNPLTICTVNRAFLLVFLEKAELLQQEEGVFLRTVSNFYPKPTVIRIRKYINVPYRGVVLTRFNIFRRDQNECQYGKRSLQHGPIQRQSWVRLP